MKYILILSMLFNVAYAQMGFFHASANDASAIEYIFYTTGATTNQKTGINIFCKDLKGTNIWGRQARILPFIGTTLASQSIDLKNPSSSNTIAWYNNPIPCDTGVALNGTTQYGEIVGNITSFSLANVVYYTNSTSAFQATDEIPFGMHRIVSGTNYYFELGIPGTYLIHGTFPSNNLSFSNSTAKGLYLMSRESTTNLFLQKDNSVVSTNTNTFSPISFYGGNFFIGARQNYLDQADFFSNKTIGFLAYSNTNGLTTSEASMYYTLFTKYRGFIGR